MPSRRKFVITGRVQGVGFRYHCSTEATRLGLVGFVRNQLDGTVEVQAQGDEASLDALENWCHNGPAFASVKSVELAALELGDETKFKVT